MFGAISIAALPSSVWADAPLTDVARAPNAQDNSKFAGSYAEGSTYVAPSSFYTSGYRDPYVSLASGSLCRTISTRFQAAGGKRSYVLCDDVIPD